jgi:hypothetical protein
MVKSQLPDWRHYNCGMNNLAEIMKNAKGKINLNIDNKRTLSLSFGQNRVFLDIKDVSFFGMPEENDDDFGIFDEVNAAKKIAQVLDDHDMTVTILRKGKKAITLGKEAKPTISRLVTSSDDIQIESLSHAVKLGKGLTHDKQSKD